MNAPHFRWSPIDLSISIITLWNTFMTMGTFFFTVELTTDSPYPYRIIRFHLFPYTSPLSRHA